MEILLVNLLDSKKDYLISRFIAQGIKAFHVDTQEQFEDIIGKKDITHIIINFDSKAIDWFDFISRLKNNSSQANYNIIAESVNKKKEFINSLLQIGVIGFIYSSMNKEQTYKKILSVLKKNQRNNERRKHIRIKLKPENNAQVTFRIPNTDVIIKGRVTDLSVVAIAFKIQDKRESMYFKDGDIIEKAQFRFKNKNMLVNLKILKSDILSVAYFFDTNPNVIMNISKIIYDKINEEVKNNGKNEKISR